MKTILVTGGTGLVGTAIKTISQNYAYKFIFISSSEYNLLEIEKVKKMFEIYKPNYIIHLAACVGGLYKNMNNKVEMLEKNLIINYNIVKCSHDYGVEKLIACLSSCIFPDKTTYPIEEESLHNGPPHDSNYAYAYAKRMLEIHCRTYREQFGDNFICIIPTNIYGPNDNFDIENGHVIPSLIHKCYLAKINGEKFIIKGSGKPLRQFIFSEDLAKMIMVILENNNNINNIILSDSEENEVTIEYIARIIAKKYNYENMMEFDSSFSDGQFKKTVSNKNIKNILNDGFEFTNIEKGINISIDWFLEKI